MITSFGKVLQSRLDLSPERLAYTFTDEPTGTTEEVSYRQLICRAVQIGAAIGLHAQRGDRVMLMIQPGIDFVASFIGCWLYGFVSIPAYPLRSNQRAARLESIVSDASPVLALVDAMSHDGLLRSQIAQGLTCLNIKDISVDPEERLDPKARVAACFAHESADEIVFLQYTSGSTGHPKGTMVSHGNLVHNSQQMSRKFGTSEQSVMVSWLPPYHDMGLILGVLQPLFIGFPCHLMSPAAFIQRPMRWLQLIASTRATISGGPNFAFDLCVKRIPALGTSKLDLSAWQVAFNGAEPIHPETLENFAATFSQHGFEPTAFHPCYGLAENTLMVSGQDASPVVVTSPQCFLRAAEQLPAGERTNTALVSCGTGILDQIIRIVDPETRVPCEDSKVGEIWVSGPSVSPGYWNDESSTTATFRATLSGEEDGRTFLRTGDLGQIVGGRLYICGRIKDLIIVRGTKYYPQDMERMIEEAHPELLFGGFCAVVQSEELEPDSVAVVAELNRERRKCDHAALAARIRATVVNEFRLRVSRVELLAPGTFPKTSSGKIPRKVIAGMLRAQHLEAAQAAPMQVLEARVNSTFSEVAE